jgi:hypothetical protein
MKKLTLTFALPQVGQAVEEISVDGFADLQKQQAESR